MTTKDELKKIADSNNVDDNTKKEVDDVLSKIYKEMYKLASQGKYKLTLEIEQKNLDVFFKVTNILSKEKFKIVEDREPTDKLHGLYTVSWEE
jgi:hypothetical protein